MKKFASVVAIATFALSSIPSAHAATATSGPYTISAQVSNTLTLSVVLKKNSSTGATITSLDFGTLQTFTNPTTGGQTLRSSTAGSTGTGSVVALVSANSHSLPYSIKQTGTALSNGTTTIPAGACTFVPVYAAADNGGLANTNTLGSPQSWVGADKTIVTSTDGSMRTYQVHYSITDDPSAGATAAVPVNQAGGTYNGQVTFTATA